MEKVEQDTIWIRCKFPPIKRPQHLTTEEIVKRSEKSVAQAIEQSQQDLEKWLEERGMYGR